MSCELVITSYFRVQSWISYDPFTSGALGLWTSRPGVRCPPWVLSTRLMGRQELPGSEQTAGALQVLWLGPRGFFVGPFYAALMSCSWSTAIEKRKAGQGTKAAVWWWNVGEQLIPRREGVFQVDLWTQKMLNTEETFKSVIPTPFSIEARNGSQKKSSLAKRDKSRIDTLEVLGCVWG